MTPLVPRAMRPLALDARTAGALMCAAGLVGLWGPELWRSALGLELLALGFWVWARAADDAREQVPRWRWLRRPAQALWLAAAVHAALPVLTHGAPTLTRLGRALGGLEALAVVWAGLELLAALPMARPYSDLPGPLLAMRPWLPVLLPAAGFLVLWRHESHWMASPQARGAAGLLLLVTAVLGTLRAFGRRQWAASLRWLTVSDSALAGLLLATGAVPRGVSFALWLGACGGRALLLAGELRGASPRRGALVSRLWRVAMWTAGAALAFPTLLAVSFGPHGFRPASFAAVSFPVALSAWVSVGRLVEAPERRRMVRRESRISIARLGALLPLLAGPIALARAWWGGFDVSLGTTALGLAPAALGGWSALVASRVALASPAAAPAGVEPRELARLVDRVGVTARALARATFRLVTALERRSVGIATGLLRALAAPLRDLHTGDAQEYLLFVVGLSVLALVLPLLQ